MKQALEILNILGLTYKLPVWVLIKAILQPDLVFSQLF